MNNNYNLSQSQQSKIIDYIFSNLDKFSKEVKQDLLSLTEDDFQSKLEKIKLTYLDYHGNEHETNLYELYEYFILYKKENEDDFDWNFIDFNNDEFLNDVIEYFKIGRFDFDRRDSLPSAIFYDVLHNLNKKHNPFNIKLKSILLDFIKEKEIDLYYVYSNFQPLYYTDVDDKCKTDEFISKLIDEIKKLYDFMKSNFNKVDLRQIIEQAIKNVID